MKKKVKTIAGLTLSLSLLPFTATGWAGEAVSALNGKLETIYGAIDNNESKAAQASLDAPLAKNIGLQLDGLVGEISPKHIDGVGGHLFWRDSELGLLGVTGSWVEQGGWHVNRAAVEGEYYHRRLTTGILAGHQSGDINDSGFGSLNLSYYPVDDLMLGVSGGLSGSNSRLAVTAEYQTPLPGLTVFVKAATGNDDYDQILGGIRYYFGGKKSLIQRHRQDEPPNRLLDSLTDNQRRDPAPAPDPTPVPAPSPALLI